MIVMTVAINLIFFIHKDNPDAIKSAWDERATPYHASLRTSDARCKTERW